MAILDDRGSVFLAGGWHYPYGNETIAYNHGTFLFDAYYGKWISVIRQLRSDPQKGFPFGQTLSLGRESPQRLGVPHLHQHQGRQGGLRDLRQPLRSKARADLQRGDEEVERWWEIIHLKVQITLDN